MHQATISWFDTAACFNPYQTPTGINTFWGMAGAATFGPEDNNGQWYEGTTESTYPKDSDGQESWRTSLRLVDGSIYWKGDNLLNLNKNFIAIMEDCDADCQKIGSGLSVVAAIN